jgi:hypothetical protein
MNIVRILSTTLLTSTLALSACSTTWDKPGLTTQQWQRDKYDCTLVGRQAAAGASAGGIISQEIEAASMRNQCLTMRGYTKAE